MPKPIEKFIDQLEPFGLVPSGDTGRQWTCRCPAHDDHAASLSIASGSNDVVLLNCFAGCKPKEICASLGLSESDMFPEGGDKSKGRNPGCSVHYLAFSKRLDAKWLMDYCKLKNRTWWKEGVEYQAVSIPYLDVDGKEICERVRFDPVAKKGMHQPKGVSLQLYGMWHYAEFRSRANYLVVVEGESDCWALWSQGVNAYGVPGAKAKNVFDSLSLSAFAGFETIYVWSEPDNAGAAFPALVAEKLRSLGYAGAIRAVSVPGAKDPCDMNARDPSTFLARLADVLAAAKDIDVTASASPSNSTLPKTVQRLEQQIRKSGVCEWGAFEFTEDGNARRLEKLHGEDLRFVKAWNSWYVWDSTRWKEDATLEIYRRASATVHSLVLESQLSPGATGSQECVKWWAKSQSARVIENTVKLARGVGVIPCGHDQFDREPWLLNCPNGMVDLRTGKLHPHDRNKMLTAICPVTYDPDAKCPTWELFLERVFPIDASKPDLGGSAELIAFVHKLLGVCLTGVILDNMLPIFWGGGSNGKSTLLGMVQEVIGQSYSMQAPTGFMIQKHTESHSTELADLFGKRMVVATETGQGKRFDEALVKQLTGGDKIRARRMRQDNWEFEPSHKLILCTNHKPHVRGNDSGIWRRLLLIPFAAKFWNPDAGEMGHELFRQDKTMKLRLASERSGILAWMVRGCLDWQKTGLERPAEIQQITDDYRNEEDVIGQFLADRFVRVDQGKTQLKAVHAEYLSWCETTGERPWASSRQLSAELQTRGILVVKGHAGYAYAVGIEQRESEPIPY